LKKPLPTISAEKLATAVCRVVNERIDFGHLVDFVARKTVPIHRSSWIYLAGGATLFLFTLQAVTGILLMLYYQPTGDAAHASVARIMTEVPYGWLVRSMHVWGANLFIATALVHFATTLVTRAYRRPRELTWFTGCGLLVTALAAGFSGYLLPWNELSYFATRVGTAIPGTVPLVGKSIVYFLRGGDSVTGETITRFYAAHVMIVPLGLGCLAAVHLMLVQFQGMSMPVSLTESDVCDRKPFFTEFVLLDARVWLVLFGVVVTLSVLLPATVGSKADPLAPAPEGIQPEWYFLFMFKTLKHVPESLGVSLFALLGLFVLAVPLIDRPAAAGRRSPGMTLLFVVLAGYVILFQLLAIIEPGPNLDHTGETLQAETYSLASSLVNLGILWVVIVLAAHYLGRLDALNQAVRQMYQRNP
jgi:cytochrome b6